MGFISDTHLPHLLGPEHYCADDYYAREIDRLFRPAWHCVAQVADLPDEGSFKTLSLLGHPLILWRSAGEIRAFLNICSHRHCLLTGAACGRMPMLRCQYHGWEFDRDGDTRRIPDARSFRPLTPGTLGLRRYRTEVVGQLVFVSLAADPMPLDEQLGGQYGYLADLFSDRWEPLLTVAQEVDANWKVLVENVLEGYHLEAVHVNTFRHYAPAEACQHDLQERFTSYTEQPLDTHRAHHRRSEFIARLLGVRPDHAYHHVFMYPNFAVSRMTMFNWAQTVLPLAPGRAINYWQIFSLRGHAQGPVARLASSLLRRHGRTFFREAMREDGVVMPGVQRGLSAPAHPSGGLVSAREERIVHFQRHVLKRTAAGCDRTPTDTHVEISAGHGCGEPCRVHQ